MAETKTETAEAPLPSTAVAADGRPALKLLADIDTLIAEADYDEVYGIELKSATELQKNLIVQKFLRANSNDVQKAKDQLLKTLKWRKEYQPQKAKEEVFSKTKFGGLGYVTVISGVPDSRNEKDIATFNIYGAVTDNKETFGDIDSFLRWRVALMELTVEQLNLKEATEPIPDFGEGPDPYQGFQIHDYLDVSFLRQDPVLKAATKKAIQVLGDHYPETLSRKFFVNVPRVMGWMFAAMKLMISRETAKKFTVVTWGKDLALELGDNIPAVYGGKAEPLETIGKALKLDG